MELVKTLQQVTENLELQKQESQPLKIYDNSLKAALQSKKVSEAGEELSACLRYAMMIAGVRGNNLPTQQEFDFMKMFVIRNFTGHTVDEIRLAFEMAVAGKLGCDVSAYENFSCEYFGRIMTAYRKWAAAEYKQIPTVVTQEPQAAPKEADWSNVWADVLEAAKAGRIENKIVPVPVYDFLVEKGELKLSVEDKKVLWLNAKNKYQVELGALVETNRATSNEKAEYGLIKSGNVERDLYTKISNRAKVQAVKELALKMSV